MEHCKTCNHWKRATPPKYSGSWRQQMTAPVDQDTYEPMKVEFEVRLCEHPAQTFCERPVERNGFGIADGSEYMAILMTAEDFGCVRHEAA